MKSPRWINGLALLFSFVCLTTATQADPVRLFAAASLQGPLDDVVQDWDTASTVSYGGSGTIARQISLGAPADAVILANPTWSQWLIENGHAPGPVRTLLSNRLVIISPLGGATFEQIDAATLRAALDGRLAMGQHMSVPAGIYAKAWLSNINAWDALRPNLAETENVRSALALVARGEAPLGIVYASDAQASAQVSVAYVIPDDQHPQILYTGLALTPNGTAFLDHLATHTAPFTAAGFVALP
ncbi:MAG: molybdate ABC transporter substrate-binding protein [Tateyamaria sp.]|uniref:molybdate ABC transporter substrate-binding protein n=1 Tax=Tateyamaria sp. TaxID=1929288 RepID=UPI00329CA8EB